MKATSTLSKVALMAVLSLGLFSCQPPGDGGVPVGPGLGILPAGSQVGFYSQTQNFLVPGYVNAGSSLQVEGGMQAMLRDAMGVCDREHISGGLASCQAWSTGAFDVVLWADGGSLSNAVTLVVRAVPGQQLNGFGSYAYSLPNFKEFLLTALTGWNVSNPSGVFNPLVLEGSIWPVNNSQGFEVRAYGPRVSHAWNKLIQFQVAQGKLEDTSWNYQLLFNGQSAARGTSVRCTSQFCGMDSSYFRY